jgi:oligoendopeptidase F
MFEDHLIATTKEKSDKKAYLIFALDRLWDLFFQWALMAELESQIQQKINAKELPTGSQISQMYLQLLQDVFGHAQGVVKIDEKLAREWINTPNIFFTYDHLFWAPSIAISCLLNEQLKKGDENAKKAIHQLLGQSNQDLSYQLFKEVNIDFAKNDAYNALLRRLENLLQQLESVN